MRIVLQPFMSSCSNFVDESHIIQCKSAIIVPIAIKHPRDQEDKDELFVITWACNYADKCLSRHCLYSRVKHKSEEPIVKGVDEFADRW